MNNNNMITENRKSTSRYKHGVRALRHKGKNVTTSVGSKMDSMVMDLPNLSTKVGVIPAGFEHRPELISNIFFGSPGYWWYLMLVIGITDPFEGFNSGDQILIPIMS